MATTKQFLRWQQVKNYLSHLEKVTRPISEETKVALAKRWEEIPDHIRSEAQTLGRMAVGCEGTHGVFPRCNFTCTPCYHSADANKVRIDGNHTVTEVEKQMSYLASIRGPHAHGQLIGGEVTLLNPEDHAAALTVMRRYGREPMSFTHGDMDYSYLEHLALKPNGKRRFKRLSFAGHFDTTMRGRRGLRRPQTEAELNTYRQAFCDMFRRLRMEHGIRYFLAHNMTIIPTNVEEIPQVIRDCHSMGFNLFSFQPAAYVGDKRRWREDYSTLDPDLVWAKIEEGAGARLPYRVFQTGDERCNRSAFGYYLNERWFPVLDDEDPKDLATRDAFLTYLGGIHWGAQPALLAIRLIRMLARHPELAAIAGSWLARRVRHSGGTISVLKSFARGKFVPMTFVMHRFMHAENVKQAWELTQRGETSDDSVILETQQRLAACFYDMAHPETGQIVPACVQHCVLDPAENMALAELLPLPHKQDPSVAEVGIGGKSC